MGIAEAISAVQSWVYAAGPLPEDTQIVTAIGMLAADWATHRADGMEKLSNADLDELKKLVEAMSEL